MNVISQELAEEIRTQAHLLYRARRVLGQRLLGELRDFTDCVADPFLFPIGSPVGGFDEDIWDLWCILSPGQRKLFWEVAKSRASELQVPAGRQHSPQVQDAQAA